MTSNENSEVKRSIYDSCDPQYLRQLREAAGMDVAVLAKTACLSVAQVRQLETEGSDALFYSDAIKRQAYKRILMILGAEPPSVEVPHELRDPGKVAQAHLETLDQIVAMSQQPTMNRSIKDVMGESVELFLSHKQVVAALSLLVVAVVLFVLTEHQNAVETDTLLVKPTVSSASVLAVASAPVVVAPVKEAEPVKQAEPIYPASATVVVASAAAPSKQTSCTHSNDVMPQLTSLLAQKQTRYVYLVGTTDAEICVVDGNKQATLVQLKAGENRSVYGDAPWQISGTQLQKTQIYFQGARVSVPDSVTGQFRLTEVPLSR